MAIISLSLTLLAGMTDLLEKVYETVKADIKLQPTILIGANTGLVAQGAGVDDNLA